MHQTVPSPEIYGPGSFVDSDFLAIPDDARRILKLVAQATPGFTADPKILDQVIFEGGAEPIVPGPIKAPAVAAALHAMCGIVANELLDERDGSQPDRRVSINTDHAAFWLGTVGFVKWNGMSLVEIANAGKLHELYKTDLEKGAFGTPLRKRATGNYPTKTPGVWYQLHGSLNAEPTLQAIGIDPETPCETSKDAYDLISRHVQKLTADELEMTNLKLGLCGNTCYSPEGWRATQMGKQLSRHPLINYNLQSYAIPTPPIKIPNEFADKRPLAGIKVVELVRVIAGPVVGTTLAAFGADVIRVNCSRLPDFNVSLQVLASSVGRAWEYLKTNPYVVQSLQLTLNAGVRTIDIDLTKEEDLAILFGFIQDADVFVQGYRPGVIASKGLSLPKLLEIAGKRKKGIVYVEENCYGPDGPFSSRPGWQQTGDAASGCSYVTGRSMGHTDGTSVLPSLPIPDMMTGLIGALGALMGLRDRARNGGSYHVFASLAAAAAYPLSPEIGLYSPEVVHKVDKKFEWESMDSSMFVLELLQVVLNGWNKAWPNLYSPESPFTTKLQGDWGTFDLLGPVVHLADDKISPKCLTAPVPHCYYDAKTTSWL
ncbi:alpha methylacyl-CoA racemase [Penicillium nucicola]|uniref:alpha methylacyl-CoA racemase n=1 Tax=Penicillium nucicola TaxID=1850975 RepID=UPI0025457F31|nr:alpha methylacyl-CoA racemase [Penicillium nucicola]KAJ5771396.1 alpha methylacyl-CoA racemase [Penicillium nucicola]